MFFVTFMYVGVWALVLGVTVWRWDADLVNDAQTREAYARQPILTDIVLALAMALWPVTFITWKIYRLWFKKSD